VEVLKDVLRNLTGRPWSFRIEVSTGPVVNSPSQAPDDSDRSPSRSRRQRAGAQQEPLVKRAVEVLGAQIVQMDPDFGAAPAAQPERTNPAEGEES
jgi:hypothetical protein